MRWTRSDLNSRCEVTSGPSSPRHPPPPKSNPQPTRTHHSAPTAGTFKRASAHHSPLTDFTGRRSQDKTPILQPNQSISSPKNPCNIQHWASRSNPICGVEKKNISPASSTSNKNWSSCHRDNLTFTKTWRRQRRRISRGNIWLGLVPLHSKKKTPQRT